APDLASHRRWSCRVPYRSSLPHAYGIFEGGYGRLRFWAAAAASRRSRYDARMTDPRSEPTVRSLLDAARGRIDAGEAGLLLGHVLGQSRGWLFAHGGDAVEPGAAAGFEALL